MFIFSEGNCIKIAYIFQNRASSSLHLDNARQVTDVRLEFQEFVPHFHRELGRQPAGRQNALEQDASVVVFVQVRQVVDVAHDVLRAAAELLQPQLEDPEGDLLVLAAVVLHEGRGHEHMVSRSHVFARLFEHGAGGFDSLGSSREFHVLNVCLRRTKQLEVRRLIIGNRGDTHQSGIDVRNRDEFVVHLVDFVVLHSSLLEVCVGEVEQRIVAEHAVDCTIQYVGRFVGECFGCVHILQHRQLVKMHRETHCTFAHPLLGQHFRTLVEILRRLVPDGRVMCEDEQALLCGEHHAACDEGRVFASQRIRFLESNVFLPQLHLKMSEVSGCFRDRDNNGLPASFPLW